MTADRKRQIMSIDVGNLRRVALVSAAVTTVAQAATAAEALPRGRQDHVDAILGPGLAAIAVTGAKRTERLMQDRPGDRDHQRRVSFFFPRPPRPRTPKTAG